jgi:putative transposase
MPSKNVLKQYESGAHYHIYNRGVDKALIFREDKDYKVFLSFLKAYIAQPEEFIKVPPTRKLKNYFGEIELLSYCLMPNHFHLLVKQNTPRGIDHFMRSLSTKYVRYFNTHYHRIGPLFQGPYKAARVTHNHQFIYLSKYIHRNPLDLSPYKESPRSLSEYPYSSYRNYLHDFTQTWVQTNAILSFFSKTNRELSYNEFVEQSLPDDLKSISTEILDLP